MSPVDGKSAPIPELMRSQRSATWALGDRPRQCLRSAHLVLMSGEVNFNDWWSSSVNTYKPGGGRGPALLVLRPLLTDGVPDSSRREINANS